MKIAAEFRPNVVLYHHPCLDGFTAAWCAHRWDPTIRLIPYDHNTGIPEALEGTRVVLLDCCLRREELLRLRGITEDLRVLDHHQSSMQACGDLPFCHFENERSGAGLAWAFFFPDEPVPPLVQFVQDQDLHTREFQDTRDFIPSLHRHGFSLEWWDEVFGMNAERMARFLAEGQLLREHFSQLLDELMARAFSTTIRGYRVLCVNAPYPFHSAVANRLAYSRGSIDFAMSFGFDNPNRVRVSFRSPQQGMDLTPLVSSLGGGGHAHAAGAILTLAAFTGLLGS